MGTEWSETTLGDIALGTDGAVDGPFGSNLPASAYTENGYPIIRGSNLTVGLDDFKDHEFVYVPEEVFQRLSRSECKAGDIIFTKKGTLGQTGLIRSEHRFDRYLLSSNQMRLRVDPSKALPEYVYYCVSSQKAINKLIKDSECTGVPKINLAYLKSFPISLPDLGTQKSIVDVLGALNKKITLNRQINQTLEQMAQTLFKSWFVDFDPVIDNALDAGNPIPDELQHRAEARKTVRESEGFKPLPDEVRQLFPDTFEESELGWVPKGWAVKTCEEISTRIGMGPFGSNIKVSTFVDSGIPVISGTHLKSVLLNDHSYNFITEDHAQKLKNSAVYRGDIVFTHAGNIGQVALIPDESDYESYMISQRQFYLRPDSSQVKSSYIVHYFHSHLGQHKLLSNASQTGVPSIARPSSHLKGIALVIPSNEVQESFDGLVTRWNEKTMRTRNNIDLLTKLRDTLLPKLISGELCLDDVEAAVEQETVSA
ncbi:restriction endonuclease subunit S [Vibrio vulnificus]|uniref:restriction endonuclease subunit S n=1 Tax=Vibrio vulnificus TaxID=672 RepID=UPI00188BAA1E|nr:restriction endonuclease subunit S [Vibrio vulnificus]MBF4451567.1 restriction endonuclease subunit S [Vibrio vulnificus]MBF4497292.1 restriction endonuclease subunit S [Vibrio vulnificus]MBL6181882.1 restriction endonuclease subunit S [Vibrio vulnificus]HDY7981860.1 restriction endonuclease subunit S [Vibrio vulnificus]HDY8005344.1 restriction endonuclease subunit S [Vibrio vulnificus]